MGLASQDRVLVVVVEIVQEKIRGPRGKRHRDGRGAVVIRLASESERDRV